MIKDVAVGGVWPAVDVEDQWILLCRNKIGRLLDPCLDLLPVEARVPDFFRLGQVQTREQLLIDVREPPLLRTLFHQKQIADAGRG